MAPKHPPHPDNKDQSTAGRKIAAGSGSPGEQFVPTQEESPTTVDLGFNSRPSNSDSSPSDSPTVVDLGSPYGTPSPGAAAQSRSSGSRPAPFLLIPGMLLAGRYEILAVL